MTRYATILSAILFIAACRPTPTAVEPSAGSADQLPGQTEGSADQLPGQTEGSADGADQAQESAAEIAAAADHDPLAAPSDVAAPPANADRSESGLAWRVLQSGTGTENPREIDTVTVHYTGWTTDGERFDSSLERGRPASFPLDGVIAGWTEGLQLMVVGEKRRFWIPVELAYNDRPGRPQGMLVFDVELIDIQHAPDPPAVPEDVAAPPAEAERSESGLAWRILTPGSGTTNPTADSVVRVHYTGWTTDGEMFDSSVTRGQPASFPLNGVIPGWTEGVQLMVEGELRRFWIPVELAYNNRPGAPAGMLVFDVELLEIIR